jgi:cytochrome P450 family 103
MTIPSNEPPRVGLAEPPTLAAEELERDTHRVMREQRPLTPLIKRYDGTYVAIRASDIATLATDPRTRQMETELAASRGVSDGPLFDFFKNTMLLSNGQEHRRRRAPMARAFALKLITELRPRIRAIASGLIDEVLAKGEMSFVEEYAALVPAHVLCELMGFPAADIPEFTQRVYTLAPVLSSGFTAERVPQFQAVTEKLIRYCDDLLQERHARPRNDFLTSYVRALAESNTLSAREALIQLVTVILAASETTRSAMTIQTSLLLQHRDQWDAVCRDSNLIPGAVLESLRYEPAVASFPRVTLEDLPIDAYVVPRNRMLSLSMISAMRDPAIYADPDRFDIRRTDHPKRPIVFGAGAHRCLGEPLATAELEEGLAALTARLPGLQFAGDPPVVSGSGGIRKVTPMRVRWGAT